MGYKRMKNKDGSMTFTIETRILKPHEDIAYKYGYLDSLLRKHSRLIRIAFKEVQKEDYNFNNSYKKFMKLYNVDSRTAKSILMCGRDHYKRLKELKVSQLKDLKSKITGIKKEIKALKRKLTLLKKKVILNKASEKELERYKKYKRGLWNLQMKLNKKSQKLLVREKELESGKLSMCWGGSNFFKKQYNLEANGFKSHSGWLNAYRLERDSSTQYYGDASVTLCNYLAKVKPLLGGGCELTLRKDLELQGDVEDKYISFLLPDFLAGTRGNKREIRERFYNILESRSAPVMVHILRRDKKWYVQCSMSWSAEEEKLKHSGLMGAIGVDFNAGFLAVAETDYYGNLVGTRRYALLRVGKGLSGESELKEAIASIVKLAVVGNKSIVIENLDFKSKRSKLLKGVCNKNYNRMLSRLNYRCYMSSFESACHRAGVELILVSPAYTSVMGAYKFSASMKLNRHISAAYYISRLGVGYERLPSKSRLHYLKSLDDGVFVFEKENGSKEAIKDLSVLLNGLNVVL